MGKLTEESTGLYAQPGDEIKILALDADGSMTDLEVQVGIHSDNLEKLDKWTRHREQLTTQLKSSS